MPKFNVGDKVAVTKRQEGRQRPVEKGATGTVKKVNPSGEEGFYTVEIDNRTYRGGIIRIQEKYLKRA